MKYINLLTMSFLFSVANLSAQEANIDYSSIFINARNVVTFNEQPTFTKNKNILLMSNGGSMGGTGYIAPTAIATGYFNPFSSAQIAAMNAITRFRVEQVALGGGSMGGTGRQVDFIIRDGEIIRINKAIEMIKGTSVIFNPMNEQLEDIELKTGDVITFGDIQEAVFQQSASVSTLMAIPVKEIENIFLINGDKIEQSQLVHQIDTTRAIQALSIQKTIYQTTPDFR